MTDVCAVCGLPKDICACQTIEKETTQEIKIYSQKERFNKYVTIVEGLEPNELVAVTKDLKRKLACGGTCKNGKTVLQGDHRAKTKEFLVKIGYPEEIIKVI
ncbi:stress response translation initiation inhibitor YciH [Candidatus Micrarchaeota archaeon]|nr:stress response translation initiation inhibitor YciH [Candidatus Micrarchaeota archaeon]